MKAVIKIKNSSGMKRPSGHACILLHDITHSRHSTATESVNNITAALVQVLKGDVLKKPFTEELKTKANEFHNR